MFIWHPHSSSRKPVHRMTGHQQLINHVAFSADGRYFASASFDKTIRIWCGITGKFFRTLRGHIGRVYRVVWSCCGSLLVSASSDTTLKLWDANTGKLKYDLPGHADEVYTLDWSNCGRTVASGKWMINLCALVLLYIIGWCDIVLIDITRCLYTWEWNTSKTCWLLLWHDNVDRSLY